MMLLPNSLVDVVHPVKLLYFGTRDKSRPLCAQVFWDCPVRARRSPTGIVDQGVEPIACWTWR